MSKRDNTPTKGNYQTREQYEAEVIRLISNTGKTYRVIARDTGGTYSSVMNIARARRLTRKALKPGYLMGLTMETQRRHPTWSIPKMVEATGACEATVVRARQRLKYSTVEVKRRIQLLKRRRVRMYLLRHPGTPSKKVAKILSAGGWRIHHDLVLKVKRSMIGQTKPIAKPKKTTALELLSRRWA